MAIYAECPSCRKKQSNKNKLCKCGEDLVKAKRSERVNYWISYYLPNGKNRRELVGKKLSDAQAAEGKRKAQKKENPRVLEKVASANITFSEVAKWYLALPSVKRLSAFDREQVVIDNFNKVFGQQLVNKITLSDLEEYQCKRKEQKMSPRSIDYETGAAQRMLIKAFDNDMIDGNALKPFRRLKKALRKGGNARKRTLSLSEYQALIENAPSHLKAIIITAFYTGMRIGEILGLQWSHIDTNTGFIRLNGDDTKEESEKNIPINHHVEAVLQNAGKIRHIKHDFVFTYRGKPITKIIRSFKKCCDNANIPYGKKTRNGLTFHDIRRTVKTNMLNAGIDKIYRDVILGHSLAGMDAFYMSPSDEDLHRAMKKFTVWLDEKMATKLKNSDQNSD